MSHEMSSYPPTPRSSGQRSGAARAAPKRWAAAALLTLALGQVAQAVDGQLDPSFDGNGQVIFDVNNQRLGDRLFGVAILPDGTIAVGGTTGGTKFRDDSNLNFVVAAFSGVNGSLDTGFGDDGLTISDIRSGMDLDDVANARCCRTTKMKARSGWWDDRVDRVSTRSFSLPRCATGPTGSRIPDLMTMGLSRLLSIH